MSTRPSIILLVVVFLGLLAAGGMLGTFLLIDHKASGELIAIFSGLTGTALGMLGSMLNNTRTQGDESKSVTVTTEQTTPPAAP